MKSQSHKVKYSAMEFARQNADIPCVFYAKVGALGVHQTEPRILAEGSCAYLEATQALHRFSRRTTNIVTKSFYEKVLTRG